MSARLLSAHAFFVRDPRFPKESFPRPISRNDRPAQPGTARQGKRGSCILIISHPPPQVNSLFAAVPSAVISTGVVIPWALPKSKKRSPAESRERAAVFRKNGCKPGIDMVKYKQFSFFRASFDDGSGNSPDPAKKESTRKNRRNKENSP
jgi:hypothetical protein